MHLASSAGAALTHNTSLTEVRFYEALQRAKELDDYFNANRRLIGPLHGVPVTLKDQFDLKGADTTLGYVARSFAPASDDAALVKMLESLGAVVLSKTNLPQSILVSFSGHPPSKRHTYADNPP